jgi:acylphosphatase
MFKQARVYVSGDVTGVGFRSWTKKKAQELELRGWVKNVFTKPHIFGFRGGVEALIQGEEENLNKMIEFLKQGPMTSAIEKVEVAFEEIQDLFETFEVV